MQLSKHKSILLIGDGGNSKYINQIISFDTEKQAVDAFTDSKLLRSYRFLCKLGLTNISVMNVRRQKDYLQITDTVRHYDFTYIVPVDILFSDYYYDPVRAEEVSYLQLWLEEMKTYNDSVIIITDKHASLYEDFDNFFDDLSNLLNKFKQIVGARVSTHNAIFVANNLANHELANVMLAGSLCITDIDKYPFHAEYGPAIFEIDSADIKQMDAVYFRNHYGRNTTVENLLNLHQKVCPEKIVEIDRIIRYIKRELDFSEFKGRPYTEYVRMKIEEKLDKFLSGLVGYILTDYHIESVQFYKNGIGSGIIINRFNIWPINSLEKCSVIVEG